MPLPTFSFIIYYYHTPLSYKNTYRYFYMIAANAARRENTKEGPFAGHACFSISRAYSKDSPCLATPVKNSFFSIYFHRPRLKSLICVIHNKTNYSTENIPRKNIYRRVDSCHNAGKPYQQCAECIKKPEAFVVKIKRDRQRGKKRRV